MIGVVDYGAGNLFSVVNALQHLGLLHRLVSKPDDFSGLQRLLLPGVGHFGAAMRALQNNGLQGTVARWLQQNRPFLGICLGMQLLFGSSAEDDSGISGFRIFAGEAQELRGPRRLHMGWNSIRVLHPNLERWLRDGDYFYFVHGYVVNPVDSKIIAASTEFGSTVPAVILQGNICAVQFHPEKSGQAGLEFLWRWGQSC
jgi:imidazole glycerol phosphate synthase glutamine amidotransferase subunit